MSMKQLVDALRQQGIDVIENELLAKHTSFAIGGPAALFCIPKNVPQLRIAIAAAQKADVPYYFLGNGTNVLFCDEGYYGLVIYTANALNEIQIRGTTIVAQAGAELEEVCVAARDAGLAGLEFAYGIPGSVGGAVYMNAGAYGGEMCDVLESVRYLDEAGDEAELPLEGLGLGYRTSVFQQHAWCILSATLRLQTGDKEEIDSVMQQHMNARREKQPLELPSAGSAFKRPEGAFAGALIDQSGLRGYQVGGAAISQKHCGFIVNLGGATCADVLAVAEDVARIVHEKTGYVLEKEIRVVEPGLPLE